MVDEDSGRSVDERLVTLEESMMHVERLVQDLDTVVRGVHDRIDDLTRGMRKLKEKIDVLAEREPEERAPDDEKPPHY